MNEKGQATIEYILVAVLIALAIVIAFYEADIEDAVHTAGENIQESLVVEE